MKYKEVLGGFENAVISGDEQGRIITGKGKPRSSI